jgi:aspartyl protease
MVTARFKLPNSDLATEPLFALIDTGASTTVLDEALAFALVPKSNWRATEVKDPIVGTRTTHELELELCVPQIDETTTLTVITGPLVAQGIHALLGRDFLADKVLIYDGRAGTVTLCR